MHLLTIHLNSAIRPLGHSVGMEILFSEDCTK